MADEREQAEQAARAEQALEGSERAPLLTAPRAPVWTAEDARALRDRALFDQLMKLLIETDGNIAEMARRIGRDRSTVRYHLRRFGML